MGSPLFFALVRRHGAFTVAPLEDATLGERVARWLQPAVAAAEPTNGVAHGRTPDAVPERAAVGGTVDGGVHDPPRTTGPTRLVGAVRVAEPRVGAPGNGAGGSAPTVLAPLSMNPRRLARADAGAPGGARHRAWDDARGAGRRSDGGARDRRRVGRVRGGVTRPGIATRPRGRAGAVDHEGAS
jgi:hypothetical protein